LSKGRRRFLKEIEELFVKVLLLAREMGVLSLGTVALDGTKIHANASRHSALSYEHAGKLEAQLKAEVGELLAKAEAADNADVPDGMSIPEELERREQRLKKLAEARAKIEARASERFAGEQAEYDAKIAAREAKAKASGKKPGGRPPAPPGGGSRAQRSDQSDRRGLADHAGGGRRV
jgi:membrane protein involved in colicin uptake